MQVPQQDNEGIRHVDFALCPGLCRCGLSECRGRRDAATPVPSALWVKRGAHGVTRVAGGVAPPALFLRLPRSRERDFFSGGAAGLEHDPEKWVPVFGKRSCSIKKLERDDDSKKSHPALGAVAGDCPFA